MEAAKEEVAKPFPKEAEYQEKMERVAELDAMLSVNPAELSENRQQKDNIAKPKKDITSHEEHPSLMATLRKNQKSISRMHTGKSKMHKMEMAL